MAHRKFAVVLHAVADDDEPSVRARLEADPWHAVGHLRIVGVDAWTVLLDGRTVRR